MFSLKKYKEIQRMSPHSRNDALRYLSREERRQYAQYRRDEKHPEELPYDKSFLPDAFERRD